MPFFESLGITSHDIALLVGCPIGGVIGSLAQAIVKTIDLNSPPNSEGDMRLASKELRELRGLWLHLRLTLGGILGFVLGLYFVGALQPTSATIAKVIALAIIAGYAAPKVWEAQEKVVDEKLKQIFGSQTNQLQSERDTTDT